MTHTAARFISFLLASAALVGAILCTGSVATASAQPLIGNSPSAAGAPLLAGDVRVWELTHPYIPEAPNPMAGDVRVWDLIHSLAE